MKNYKILLFAIVILIQGSSLSSQTWQKKEKNPSLLFGEISTFSFGEAAFMDVDTLTNNKVVVVYRDWDYLGFGTAKIGTFSDDKITFSDSVVFSTSSTFLPKVKTVNDSLFLVIYRDMDQSGKGMILKGVYLNDSLVFSPAIPFSDAMISTTSIVLMDNNSFLIAYKDNSNNGFGTIRTGNLESGNIVLNPEIVFNYATSYENVLTRLSDTTFLISYRDAGNNEAGTVRIGKLAYGEINFGEAYVFSPTPSREISATRISSSGFLISYSKDNQAGECILGNYENGELDLSNPFVFSDTEIGSTSTSRINDSIAIISFSNEINNSTGTAILAKINSDEIVFSDPVIFNPEGSFTLNETVLSDSTFILVFRDGGNGFSGSAVIGKIQFDPLTGIRFSPGNIDCLIFPNPTNGLFYIEGKDIRNVEVMNLSGQKILSSNIVDKKSRFDLSGLERGVYFVKISIKDKIEIRKLVVE
jgi:hypothetical protein